LSNKEIATKNVEEYLKRKNIEPTDLLVRMILSLGIQAGTTVRLAEELHMPLEEIYKTLDSYPSIFKRVSDYGNIIVLTNEAHEGYWGWK
jgi:hypothetical protein